VSQALRLVLFDATQRARKPAGLGLSWQLGSALYRGLGRVDAAHGARSLADAFDWLARYEPSRAIAEVQYWGHGKWGRVFIDRECLDRSALSPTHTLRPRLDALRQRLAPGALIWFRTCETLGAQSGQDFASALADFSGATVAGHTFVIGFFQSGLHSLAPGATPHWSNGEGLAEGSAENPIKARPSGPHQPNTITCFTGKIPPESAHSG
jgi:hypothetical protein